MATNIESTFPNLGNSCLQCRVYRFRKHLNLQNNRHIYFSPNFCWLALYDHDNALSLWRIVEKVLHGDDDHHDHHHGDCKIENVTR